ncbi:helix-turn-helix domain-containing protein [Nocardioides stalactiti]|uniref:helix-turn-helix domain-containing protein n=1 Tax=Nocardioides stalactiti TaxID=2755356 RepID=UPI0015FF5B83|nr:helix-turn-helix transcriptional regulator [Nocardioides stalactiti]
MNDLDRDDAVVVDMLKAALVESGLSQAGFGRALGTSASRMSTYLSGRTRPSASFVVRAQRLGKALEKARRRRLASAPTTSLAVRRHLLLGDEHRAREALLDGQRSLGTILAADDDVLADAWDAEPTSVGSPEWDQVLAAMAAQQHEEAGRTAPGWARRVLADLWPGQVPTDLLDVG